MSLSARAFYVLAIYTFAIGSSPNLQAAERVALVIGNTKYQHARELANATHDAQSVSALLTKSGFEVVSAQDAGVEATYAALEKFKRAAIGARVGLFYFAGHGVEVEGKNYLIPVDALLENSSQLRTQTLALETVLSDMKDARLPAKMLILDCCRDNPLPTRSWLSTRSVSGGLAELKDDTLPEATMVMYASAPGKPALDGEGSNSPFTTALMEQFAKPGQTAFETFRNVAKSVAISTSQKQVPWLKFDGAGLTFDEFSFAVVGAQPVVMVKTMPTETTPPAPIPTLPTPVAIIPPPIPTPADLPSSGFFGLDDVFQGSSYAGYNRYSRGLILKKAQEKLKVAGLYGSSADGVMGKGTQKAILSYQQQQGIPVTGRLDGKALVALNLNSVAEVSESPPPAPVAPEQPTVGAVSPQSPPGIGSRPTLYYFRASWCPPCVKMEKEVFPAASVRALKSQFNWQEIDTDKKNSQALAAQFGVQGIPHCSIVSAKGKILATKIGACSETEFTACLRDALAKAAR